jgi:hypothetical protein
LRMRRLILCYAHRATFIQTRKVIFPDDIFVYEQKKRCRLPHHINLDRYIFTRAGSTLH